MSTRRYDAIDRFFVFVEQLELAYVLLDDGLADSGLAKARAALVGVDNLASVLLRANAERVFERGEGSRITRPRRYTNKEQHNILKDFDRMVTLAAKDAEGLSLRRLPAITDETDSDVMRVAHTYRNGIYHEDRHNAALLPLLTALYAHAVGRAFCQFHGHGWSYGVDPERAKRLAALGYDPKPDRFMPSESMLDFGEAAQTITEGLARRLTIDEKALRVWLVRDIVDRTRRLAGTVLGLLDDGMPAERLEWVFFWSQFWAKHGADEKWLELEDERDDLAERLPAVATEGCNETDPAVVAYRAAAQAYAARGHELQQQFKGAVSWGDAPRLGAAGKRLASAQNVGSLLARYRRIDQDVEHLETATMRAVQAWDTIIQEAVDRARDKN